MNYERLVKKKKYYYLCNIEKRRTGTEQMKVCIAEKPSVARDIARILGATSSHDGYMEGNGYQVTWTFGHLCELKEPNDLSLIHISEPTRPRFGSRMPSSA